MGTVQEVDFREYVAVVMAAEWPERYPIETLKAGAVATKQFGWYYVINPRGGKVRLPGGKRACYDVVDTTSDQVYYPERYRDSIGPRIRAAINATWPVTVRKFNTATQSSKFFLTGYRAGSGAAACGEDAMGFRLFHNSTRKCGEDGLKYREILRLYLKPRLEIVTSGRHDIIGTPHGDTAATIRSGGTLATHVWTPNVKPPEPGSSTGIGLASTDLLSYRSSDADSDGRDDLVWLKKTGARSGRIKVALSDGTNYGDGQVWFDGDMTVPLIGSRFFMADFNADGRQDAALLSRGASPGEAVLVIFRKWAADRFSEPVTWWSGPLDLDNVKGAWAGDVSGDGRADLIVRTDMANGGIRLKTAVGKSDGPGLGPLLKRFQSSWIKSAKTKMVLGDANRDGRDDLLMITKGANGPTRVERLQGKGLGGLRRVRLWSAPSSDPILIGRTRLGATDLDNDGRTDLVLFSRKGDGTRMRVLRLRYTTVVKGPDRMLSSVDFADVTPY